MSSSQALTSSGSEGDERKRKRMISNRESARRSRIRKQLHLDDLIGQISKLQKQNSELVRTTDATQQLYNQVESENQVLKARLKELHDRVQSLERLANLVQDTSPLFKNLPEISDPLLEQPWQLPVSSDPLLEPWQLPFSSQPIMASADMGPIFF